MDASAAHGRTNLTSPAAAGLRILRIGSVVLALLGSTLWGVWTFFEERKHAVDEAYANVALVRQYAERLIQTQTILQEAVQVHAAARSEPDYLHTEAFHAFLRDIEAAQSFTLGLAVVQFDGRLVASSRSFPVDATFGEREYLTRISGGSELFLDRITLQPSGEDALVVARPFSYNDFRGAIVSAVGIEAIREFLRSIASDDGAAASLLRDDGRLLVRNVPSQPTQLQASAPALQAISSAPFGHYEAVAVSDGVQRLYAYSQLADLPVFANFGIPVGAIWARWFMTSAPVWLLLLSGGTFSWILSGLIRRSFQERLEKEEQASLRVSAEQKAALQERFMRELNHRVKNNLTLVDSLIAFQMRRPDGIDGSELRARVRAISDVHDLLYKAADSYHVDLATLVRQLCESPALVPQESGITLTCGAEHEIVLDAGTATSIALIVVELVTNAVKHAFVGRAEGTIRVQLAAVGAEAELLVADNGVGFPAATNRSSGTRIVQALTEQVQGRLERASAGGTEYRLRFSLQQQ